MIVLEFDEEHAPTELIPWSRTNSKRDNVILIDVETNISTITCPKCSFQKAEEMPTDSCIFFYECERCNSIIKPLPGDCCVFCSNGTLACPPRSGPVSCC